MEVGERTGNGDYEKCGKQKEARGRERKCPERGVGIEVPRDRKDEVVPKKWVTGVTGNPCTINLF